MPSLGEFGILPPRSASEPRYQERTTISHNQFCRQAGGLLLKLRETVVTECVPNLETYPANWQPMGFQIYDLGIYPELGFLRLHVWPADVRRVIQKPDIIHNHPRHIASLVLAGTYRDSLFDVRQADESEDAARRYTVYGKTINPDQTEALVSEGTVVYASVQEDRVVAVGGEHFIEPGVFHQTKIPLAESCATLIFNSFRTGVDGPYVLLDEPPSPLAEPREAITPDEIEMVKELLSTH